MPEVDAQQSGLSPEQWAKKLRAQIAYSDGKQPAVPTQASR
jgi:hypothetical protein